MPAPSPLVSILLGKARDAEDVTEDSGLVYLKTVRDAAVASVAAGGLLMNSASEAGKTFTYLQGYPLPTVMHAIDQALRYWISLDRAMLDTLLDTKPITRAVLSF